MAFLIRAWLAAVLLVLVLVPPGVAGAEGRSGLDAATTALLARARAGVTQPCPDAGDRLDRILCANTLRVGVRGDYSHFATFAEGHYSGYEIDLASRIAQQLRV